ncbi:hypothetical protein VIGAN_07203000, partial [Vigna angularis var. angularis]
FIFSCEVERRGGGVEVEALRWKRRGICGLSEFEVLWRAPALTVKVSERDLNEEVAIALCGGRDWHRGGVVVVVGGAVVLVSWRRR